MFAFLLRPRALATFSAALVIAVPALLAAVLVPSAAHGAAISPQPAFGAVAFGTSGRLGTLFKSGPSALLPICGNTLGLPTGTIAISSAQSALHASTFRAGSGFAYGTRVQSERTVRSGRTAPSYLPCGGTSGATTHNSSAAFAAKGLDSAAVHTSTRSTDSAAATTVVTRSEISRLNLLGGAIKASAIVSRATAKRAGDTLTRSSGGTTVSGFTINGQTQSANQPANTVHSIPGIGTLYVHKVVKSATGVHVYALQLVLSNAQDGLAKGTTINVGATYAAVAASEIG